jgi:sugar phosphate isomerase/epimerase
MFDNAILQRRAFLSGAVALGGVVAADPLLAKKGKAKTKQPTGNVASDAKGRYIKNIGIQLWTVREAFKADPYGTIRLLGELGYKELEYANLDNLPITPAELRKACDAVGIKIPAGHFNPPVFASAPDTVKSIAATLGCKYVINSWIDEKERTKDGYYKQAEWFNKVGADMRKSGFHYGFHNHEFEFEKKDGDLTGQDILFRNTDPKLVDFELDMCWVVVGGADIIQLMNTYKGRIKTCHVKDPTPDLKKQVSVGDGIIKWGDVFKHYKTAGLEHFFVEDDDPPSPVREPIKRSIDYLNKLRF